MYRRPDHRWLLQTHVWQDFDLFPKFPELKKKFLNFWIEKLDGPLHSVIVAHARLIKPAELNAIDDEFTLHQGEDPREQGNLRSILVPRTCCLQVANAYRRPVRSDPRLNVSQKFDDLPVLASFAKL
jgi:uncharacterized protein Usg